jgi:hypothetical protein
MPKLGDGNNFNFNDMPDDEDDEPLEDIPIEGEKKDNLADLDQDA